MKIPSTHRPLVTVRLLLALLLGLALAGTAQAARQTLDGIAAVVDNSVILHSELDEELQRIRARIRAQGNRPPSDAVLREQVLEHLIIKKIQLLNAARKGIRVDDTQLNDQIAEIAARNHLSVAQLKAELENEGDSYASYRKNLREEMILQQLRQRSVYERIVVSEQEVDDFLAQNPIGSEEQEYQLQHILIGVPEEASPEDLQKARATAVQLREQLQAGVDFAELAIAYSSGQRALEGGNLGWLKRQQVPTLFAPIIDKLKKGQTAQPVRSPSGFHLLKLIDSRGEQRRLVQQARVRHILIKPDIVTSMAQARAKIGKLRERIRQGEDFAALAKAHSADSSAGQGGDLGWAEPEQYVPPFQRAVDNLPLNTVSEPIRTRFGWHIVEVLERRDYDETDEYRRNLARRNLRELKAGEEEELWLRRIRDQAYVEYRIPGMGENP